VEFLECSTARIKIGPLLEDRALRADAAPRRHHDGAHSSRAAFEILDDTAPPGVRPAV
jgi:hypothetical protein